MSARGNPTSGQFATCNARLADLSAPPKVTSRRQRDQLESVLGKHGVSPKCGRAPTAVDLRGAADVVVVPARRRSQHRSAAKGPA